MKDLIFKDEFYEKLSKYTVEEVNAATECFDKEYKDYIISKWGRESVEKLGKPAYRVFYRVSKVIEIGLVYKESILSKFPDYSLTKIYEAFRELKIQHKKAIRKLYNFDVSKKEVKEKTNEEENYMIRYGLKRMKQLLIGIEYNFKKILFYELFKGEENYTKEEIDLVLSTLNDEYKMLIKKKYGKNLDEYHKLNKLDNDQMYFGATRCIKSGLKKLRRGYKTFSIEDIFGVKIDTLKEYIDKLDDSTKEYYYIKFGSDLKRRLFALTLDNNMNQLVGQTMKKRLCNIMNENKPIKDFYSRLYDLKLDNESDEEFHSRINESILSCNFGVKMNNLLFKAFGNDLMHPSSDLDEKEKSIVSRYIVHSIRKNLITPKSVKYEKLFFDRFPIIFDKKEILEELEYLTIEELKVLKIKYGENLDGIVKIGEYSAEINRYVKCIIDKMVKRLIKRKSLIVGISKDDMTYICSLVHNDDYDLLLEYYDAKVSLAVLINLYAVDLSFEQIEMITGISSKEFVYISREFLQRMKNDEVILKL